MCFHVGFKEEIVLEKPQLLWKGNQDVKPCLCRLSLLSSEQGFLSQGKLYGSGAF